MDRYDRATVETLRKGRENIGRHVLITLAIKSAHHGAANHGDDGHDKVRSTL
jgi:hypothetical protein